MWWCEVIILLSFKIHECSGCWVLNNTKCVSVELGQPGSNMLQQTILEGIKNKKWNRGSICLPQQRSLSFSLCLPGGWTHGSSPVLKNINSSLVPWVCFFSLSLSLISMCVIARQHVRSLPNKRPLLNLIDRACMWNHTKRHHQRKLSLIVLRGHRSLSESEACFASRPHLRNSWRPPCFIITSQLGKP